MATIADIDIRQFSRLLDALNCGAMIVDSAGRIMHANARLAEMLGRPAAELVGIDPQTLYADPAAVEFFQARRARPDEPYEGEFYIPRGDGTRMPVLTSGRPLNADCALHGCRIVTLIDITGQKAAEEDLREQVQTISSLSDTVLDQALALKRHSEALEERVRQRTEELHDANMDAIFMLAVASEAKDADTGAHVRRIQRYTELIAGGLGLPAYVVREYGYSALLHDVGKMSVPDQILKKPGPLSPEERREVEGHATAGERILSTKPFFRVARQIARHHHEDWDGGGYPDRLAGEAIPLAARIVRLVDVYDALTSARVYKPAWPAEKAAAAIRDGAGRAFDPAIAKEFGRAFNDGRLFVDQAL